MLVDLMHEKGVHPRIEELEDVLRELIAARDFAAARNQGYGRDGSDGRYARARAVLGEDNGSS